LRIGVGRARMPISSAAWNLFGLADLVIAVTMGMLSSPSPFQLFAFDLPNELISRFPLVLVPVFLVPVSLLLHLASLTKLRRGAARQPPSRNRTRSGGFRVVGSARIRGLTLRAVLADMPGPRRRVLASIFPKAYS
jgi:hypothetical protein